MTDRRPYDPARSDFRETAKRSQEAGIADESAVFAGAASDEIPAADEEAPGPERRSSTQPAEGDEVAAPRLPGSPD